MKKQIVKKLKISVILIWFFMSLLVSFSFGILIAVELLSDYYSIVFHKLAVGILLVASIAFFLYSLYSLKNELIKNEKEN